MFMSFLQRYADTGSYAKYDFKTRTRTQFPLRRAFAMTYHKSQGLLFNSFDYTNDASVLAFQLNCFLRVVVRRAFAMTYHKSQGLLIKFNSFDYTNDASVLAFQLNCFLRVVVFCCSIISFVRFYNIFSEVDDPHVQTLQKVIFLLDFNFVFVNQNPNQRHPTIY
jgi:hypothetical protein